VFSKLAIGTANFGMPYGILATGNSLSENDVKQIVSFSLQNNITTFDTALAYHNAFDLLLKNINDKSASVDIIIKFNLKDNFEDTYLRLKNNLLQGKLTHYSSILIHDPSHVHVVDKQIIIKFFDRLLSEGICKKVGVSVYSFEELESVRKIYPISIAQCPINPLSQSFLTEKVISFVNKHHIEMHARSLFLQGILLSNNLPKKLADLQDDWDKFRQVINYYGKSPLELILKWAFSHTHISKWVLGISSLADLSDIIAKITAKDFSRDVPCFRELQVIQNKLIDPRSWPT